MFFLSINTFKSGLKVFVTNNVTYLLSSNQIIHFIDEFLLLGSSKGRGGGSWLKGNFHPKYLSTCCGSGTSNINTGMGTFQLQLFICRVLMQSCAFTRLSYKINLSQYFKSKVCVFSTWLLECKLRFFPPTFPNSWMSVMLLSDDPKWLIDFRENCNEHRLQRCCCFVFFSFSSLPTAFCVLLLPSHRNNQGRFYCGVKKKRAVYSPCLLLKIKKRRWCVLLCFFCAAEFVFCLLLQPCGYLPKKVQRHYGMWSPNWPQPLSVAFPPRPQRTSDDRDHCRAAYQLVRWIQISHVN